MEKKFLVLFCLLLVAMSVFAVDSNTDDSNTNDSNADDSNTDDSNEVQTDSTQIACTMEYAPVCGATYIQLPCECPTGAMCKCATQKVIKTYGNKCMANAENATILYEGECKEIEPLPVDCICTKEYMPVCGANGNTYSNKCMAKCVGVEIISEGTCAENSTEKFCGGIAAIQCPSGFTCKLDGTYPDAGGKCIFDCPIYSPPYCPNGEVVSKTDERGCVHPFCKVNVPQDFYKIAYGKCSNGKEFYFGETNGKCVPIAEWKQKANEFCNGYSTKCATTIPQATTSTTTTTPAPTNTSTTTSATNPITGNLTATSGVSAASGSAGGTSTTISKCIGGEVYVIDFQVKESCDPNCEINFDENGCKIKKCSDGRIESSCSTQVKPICEIQPYEEIKKMKDECYKENGQVVIKLDDEKCQKYECAKSSDKDFVSACITQEQIPIEKYSYCEQNGGKYLTKFNENNCLVWSDCVGAKEDDLNKTKINKEIISDQGKLLELALKLESLKIDLAKTAEKTSAIADYYTSVGKDADANKFLRATELLNQAVIKIDEVKKIIRDNVSSFTEEEAIQVKEAIKNIREEILKEVLLAMLE
ncbi:MAG: Kazal-type serine protease inhibitor family protein [archaeon]|jgi:hypothetical protein